MDDKPVADLGKVVAAPVEQNEDNKSGVERGIIKFGNVLALLFLASVLISVYEVVARFVFNSPTIWVHETTSFFVAICLVFGGLYCYIENKHIRIDIVYEVVPTRVKFALDVFVEIAQLTFFIALSYASWIMAEKSWFNPLGDLRLEESGSAFRFPSPALIKAFIFICLIFMAVFSLKRLISLFRKTNKMKDAAL
ncbi:MAG: TRAP transporter small permease [OCS116 cluster bacterium]|uniref:TRAP transporter small permease protein n=1 Tax=OCS116 cluster bacterium TaxID=2030921 RepID=A0A2A4YZU9_9PROT|nr:TRAP transporter small permease [OCS116 cluster bacterium]